MMMVKQQNIVTIDFYKTKKHKQRVRYEHIHTLTYKNTNKNIVWITKPENKSTKIQ